MKVGSDAVGAIATRRSSSLTGIVQREVERMIAAGDLEAGQRINEKHLATRLGVSRGPIREALRALERAGLVQSIVNVGTFVRQVGLEEASEMYDMRAVVFGFACARVAEQATAEEKEALTALVKEMDLAIIAANSTDYYQLNLRFHDLIMEYSAHKRAGQIYEALVREGHLFRQRSLQPVASMLESNSEHAAMLAGILIGDPAAARQAAEDHHQGGKRRWLATLAPQQPEIGAEPPPAEEEEFVSR